MTRCPKCGQESPDQARFCRFCGNRLTAGVEASAPDPGLTSEQRGQRLLEEAFRLSEQGRVLAAIQTCQQALAMNPNSTSAHSLLGTLYERQGDRDRAIREYEQVLTLSPASTVERRRLNELMGVPTAREPVLISPRVARLAIAGGSTLLALILFAAFMTTRSGPGQEAGRPDRAPRPGATASAQTAEGMEMNPLLPTPGRTMLAPRMMLPPPPAPRMASQGPAGAGGPVGPANPPSYIIPTTGGDRYYSGSRGAGAAMATGGATPYQGAPVVAGGSWTPGGGWSAQSGREYYLQGDYQQAANSYRSYLTNNPAAGGAPREELAWVYMQMGERNLATQEYRNALSNYQSDIERGHDLEAARHGVRTCQSAIRALQAR